MNAFKIHPIDPAEYRKSDGVNQSLLKAFDSSPAHALHAITAKPEPPTADMILGLVVEAMVFGTPFKYTTSPYDDFRTKDARDWRNAQKDQGVEVISQDTMAQATAMTAAVRKHPEAARIIAKGTCQVAMYADFVTGEGDSVLRKGLADWVCEDMLLIADLKTTQDASRSGFSKACLNFRYDMQAAYYMDLWKACTGQDREFAFIAVEKTAPYPVAVYVLDQESVSRGRADYERHLKTLMKCQDADQWPGYGDEAQYLSLPKWFLNQTNQSDL